MSEPNGRRRYASFSYESSSENLDAIAAQLSYDRADAWARSAKGTPYGGTEPVLDAPKSGTVPDPLDPRVMARLLKTEAKL